MDRKQLQTVFFFQLTKQIKYLNLWKIFIYDCIIAVSNILLIPLKMLKRQDPGFQ